MTAFNLWDVIMVFWTDSFTLFSCQLCYLVIGCLHCFLWISSRLSAFIIYLLQNSSLNDCNASSNWSKIHMRWCGQRDLNDRVIKCVEHSSAINLVLHKVYCRTAFFLLRSFAADATFQTNKHHRSSWHPINSRSVKRSLSRSLHNKVSVAIATHTYI